MCKNWEENGFCQYGRKCRFAHGKDELVDKFLVNKCQYKSKFCQTFHSKNYCPYGNRCLFIHNNLNLEELLGKFYYSKKINNMMFSNQNRMESRLEVFSNLNKKMDNQFSN